ncbi:hypothetical protein C8R46DRAFT_1351592 [Mycena filopes]|nr:hypothetical protein C8R46DRAFT_1351592 [Mycena filopes]
MDTDDSAPEPQLTRAEGLWFDDCGLIIQAERTLFRVSRDFLATRSPVFGDMLSLPTPQDAELMEGCPFVRLPDSAEDVTYFLKALLYYEFFEPPPTRTSFPVIAGILRMSHKYEVDVLRKRALAHLASAISLARQTSALWILPIAFYRASTTIDIREIMTGIEGCTLTPADAVACVQGLRFLDTTATSEVLNFLWSPEVDGCGSAECEQGKLDGRIEGELWRSYDHRTKSRPHSPLEMWEDDHFAELEVCGVCKPPLRSAHALAGKVIWDRLPGIFDLPSWAELEQMKAVALEELSCWFGAGAGVVQVNSQDEFELPPRQLMVLSLERVTYRTNLGWRLSANTQLGNTRQLKNSLGCSSRHRKPFVALADGADDLAGAALSAALDALDPANCVGDVGADESGDESGSEVNSILAEYGRGGGCGALK